jgi:hypothetical protein
MNSFSGLFQKEHMGELLLAILFIIYLIMGYKTPQPVANVVDTIVGKIAVFAVVIYMFSNSNPILAILTLMVAFDLVRRSYIATGNYGINNYMPSEGTKMNQFTAMNQFPYTLEQEMVKRMAPIIPTGTSMKKASYKPLLDNLYDAAKI